MRRAIFLLVLLALVWSPAQGQKWSGWKGTGGGLSNAADTTGGISVAGNLYLPYTSATIINGTDGADFLVGSWAGMRFDIDNNSNSGGGNDFRLTNHNGANILLNVRESGSISIGTGTVPSANGSAVLSFADNTADPTMGTNTGGIYAKDVTGTVEVFTVDEAGNVTQQTPHDPASGKWIFYSKNTKTGRVLRIEMEELMFDLAAEMSNKTGKIYIHESDPLH